VPHPQLEDVFKLSGLPVYAFVRPVEYEKLLIALRTPGRGVVIEGPSGIGKTTAVKNALEDLGISDRTLLLSARKSADRDLISELPQIASTGVVIIDDFHRLNDPIRGAIADHLKSLADEEAVDSKIIILGINKAGQSLVQFARDLNTRIDIIKFEANPEYKVQELVEKGEQALNVQINTKNEIVAAANGSFFIAQMLCHESCLSKGILDAQECRLTVDVSFEVV
jgi:Holliday junction resolvasome RuvABC ATP-dependent DNA helicase subunit